MVDPNRITFIVLEFEEPVSVYQLRAVHQAVQSHCSLPKIAKAYRTFSDGFSRLVNAKLGGGSEL